MAQHVFSGRVCPEKSRLLDISLDTQRSWVQEIPMSYLLAVSRLKIAGPRVLGVTVKEERESKCNKIMAKQSFRLYSTSISFINAKGYLQQKID